MNVRPVSQTDESALRGSQARGTQPTADRNAGGDQLTSQESHPPDAYSEPGAHKAPEATAPHLWTRGRAGGGAGVGEPGLHLCGTADTGPAPDGPAPGT